MTNAGRGQSSDRRKPQAGTGNCGSHDRSHEGTALRESGSPEKRTVPYLLVALLAVLPFLGAFGNGFVFDDQGLVLENPAVWADSFWEPFRSRYWPNSESAGLYRPVTTVSFWLDGRLWDRDPRGFIATNLLLHAAVSVLLLACLRVLFPRRRGATLATGLLYAVHPLHSEAVVGIVGRAELLAALGSLGAYRLGLAALLDRSSGPAGGADGIAHQGPAPGGGPANPAPVRLALVVASSLVFLGGLLAKESATGFLLLLGLHFLPRLAPTGLTSRRTLVTLGSTWGVAIALALLARIRVLGDLVALGPVSRTDNVLAHVGPIERILTALSVQAQSALQLLWPARLSPDYSYPEIVPSALRAAGGSAWALLAILVLAFALRHRRTDLLWAWGFVLASSLLTANLLFPIGTVYGERLAYLPSGGLVWLAVVAVADWVASVGRSSAAGGGSAAGRTAPAGRSGAGGLGRALPRLAPTCLALVLAALAVRSAIRVPEWRSNVTLFTAATQTSTRSAKAWTNLGLARIQEGDVAGGLTAADQALVLDPDYPAAIQARGSALVQLGRADEAIPLLERNRALPGKRGLEAELELGNAHLALGDGEAALSRFSAARTRAEANDERWMVGLASAYALLSNWPESRRYWQNAVAVRPEDAAFRQRLAYVLWQDGAADEAEAAYRGLLAELPEDPGRMNELAWFLATTGRAPGEALGLAERAFALRPDDNLADTLLEALLRARGCAEARSWLDRVGAGLEEKSKAALEAKYAGRCHGGDELVPEGGMGRERSGPEGGDE